MKDSRRAPLLQQGLPRRPRGRELEQDRPPGSPQAERFACRLV